MDKKRKTFKKIIIAVLAVFLVWITFAIVDYLRVNSFNKPIFSIPSHTADDGGSGTYRGLGYSFELRGNFMPEDELPGVTYYEYYLLGRFIKDGNNGSNLDGASTFMSYEGPVFPLAIDNEDEDISASRDISFDFSYPSEDSLRVWGTTVTDSYTISYSSREEKTIKAIYPFTSSFQELNDKIPKIVVDGKNIEGDLYPGSDFADSSYLQESSERANGFEISDWKGYKSLLGDDSYEKYAFSPKPELDQQVTVYTFTDFQSPKEYDAATQAISFKIDPEKTRVLSYGFNGLDYGEDGFRSYSYFVPKEHHAARNNTKMLIVIGNDFEDYSLGGYKTGATEVGNKLEGVSVNITKSEDKLKDLMGELIDNFFELYDSEIKFSREMFLEAVSDFVYKHDLFSIPETDNYSYGVIDDIIALTHSHERVFYLSFEVTIPAGENTSVTAHMHKDPSHDYSGSKSAKENVQGYALATHLGSHLTFTSLTATVTSEDKIKMIKQNFGFELSEGITKVELDKGVEHYYLEIKPIEQ